MGVCYRGWRNAGHKAHAHLYLICLQGFGPVGFAEDFNHVFCCFILKNVSDPTTTHAASTPELLRTLSILNTDHKIIAAALAKPFYQLAQQTALASQRGGTAGRMLVENMTLRPQLCLPRVWLAHFRASFFMVARPLALPFRGAIFTDFSSM